MVLFGFCKLLGGNEWRGRKGLGGVGKREVDLGVGQNNLNLLDFLGTTYINLVMMTTIMP